MGILMLRCIPALLALAMGTAAAVAQTKEQKNVMQHAAVLFVAEKWCTEHAVDTMNISRAAREAKVRIDTEPFRSYIKSEIEKTQSALSDAGIKDGCAVIYSLYGPKGSAVSGQMMRK
jgi:hypothetical protein